MPQQDLLAFMQQGRNQGRNHYEVPEKRRRPTRKSTKLRTNDDDSFSEDALLEELSDSDADSDSGHKHSQRLRPSVKRAKVSNSAQEAHNLSQTQNHGSPWIDKYRPQDISEIAIHSKKLEEVRIALSKLLDKRDVCRLLIVSGPAGSSKTTVIKSLMEKEYGYGEQNIIEWSNPDYHQSKINAFEDFLSGMSIKRQQEQRHKSLILVEDLPNIMHTETKKSFVMALLQWINMPKGQGSAKLPPLVLIITEVEPVEASSWTDVVVTERILPRRLLDHPMVTRVKTMPTNATLTTKALKNICAKEGLAHKIPKKQLDQTIKEIASFGDIRSSISSLEFWARWWSTDNSMAPLGREQHINLFHAIGRVVYGSSKDKLGNPIKPDSEVIESVLHDWEHTNRDGTLSLAIHENFPAAHSSRLSLEGYLKCSEWLSDSDLLIAKNNGRDSNGMGMGLNLSLIASDFAVRGVRTEIRTHPAVSTMRPFHRQTVYPREKKLVRARIDAMNEIDLYVSQRTARTSTILSRKDAILVDGFYEHCIARQRQKQRSLWSDNSGNLWKKRVSGMISSGNHELRPDSTIDEDEDLAAEPSAPPTLIEMESEFNSGLVLTDDDIYDSEESDF